MASLLSSIELHELSLASYALDFIPPEVYTYRGATGLTSLNVFENHLAEIPVEIFSSSPLLTSLNFCQNKITTLPEAITMLTGLSTLLLADNELAAFPDVLWAVSNDSNTTCNPHCTR
jgi:Leucine-rich repeat (LRR) protein